MVEEQNNIYTLSKVQKICVRLAKSEDTFNLLQWLSMRKLNLKHKKIKKTFILKTILHILYFRGDPTYVEFSQYT